MQIRIVTGQPWEAPADVLVVPVVGDPDFSGPLGELDDALAIQRQLQQDVEIALPE